MAATFFADQMANGHSLRLTLVSNSVHNYLNYSKQMQIRLAEINDNVSNVIKESCTGIDDICNKVRQCLFEMDHQRDRSLYVMDEVTEYEIVEEGSKTCEEMTHDIDETATDTFMFEVVEDEKLDSEQSAEDLTTLVPFLTEIDCDNKEEETDTEIYDDKTTISLTNEVDFEITTEAEEKTESRISFDNFTETVNILYGNFEIMNKLVENIHEEISKFSETALPSLTSYGAIEIKESKLKPIKRLSKCNSRQKSVQVGDDISEIEIDFIGLPGKDSSSSFLIPEVYRKRGFTDLYKRFIDQLEANDSLMFFQKLMKKHKSLENKSTKNFISQIKLNIPAMTYPVPTNSKPTTKTPKQPEKKLDVSKKFAGSLWFSQRHIKKTVASRNSFRKEGRRKSLIKAIENKSSKVEYAAKKNKNDKKTSISESNTLHHCKRNSKNSSLLGINTHRCHLGCTCRMVVENNMPPSPSTKCHLQWLREKTAHASHRKLKFLDILDDLTTRDLLPLQSEYPRKDNQKPRALDYKEVQDTFLYKLMYGKQSSKKAWKQLLQPIVKTSRIVCKKSRSANSRKKEVRKSESFMDQFCTQNYSRTDILKKLSRYMFDPEKQIMNYPQIVVMPVRVYYDNLRTNEPPTRLRSTCKPPVVTITKKISPAPGKAPLKMNCATPVISKPLKVIYNALPRKADGSPAPKCLFPSPKPLASSARLQSEKKQMKNVISRSFSPISFAPYCHDTKNTRKVKNPGNQTIYNRIQMDIEKIKSELYGRNANNTERKIWANKYGKSVGRQLISFVQHQEPEAAKPVPRYAMPTLPQLRSPERKNVSTSFKMANPQRLQPPRTNNVIQNNIKKAIDVIEKQMMDMLSADSNSVAPFDVMEKEITNVLSMMKRNRRVPMVMQSKKIQSKVSDQDVTLDENFNIISDQLFERLQRILDTGPSSVPETPTDGSTTNKTNTWKEKEEVRKKKLPSSRRHKINVLSPSTSASMDEKVVRRSPRVSLKRMEKTGPKSKLSTTSPALIPELITKENWEGICGDQNTIKITSQSESHISQDIKKDADQEKIEVHISVDEILENSRGDFVKQEVENNEIETSFYDLETAFYDIETDNATNVNIVCDDIVTEDIFGSDAIKADIVDDDAIEEDIAGEDKVEKLTVDEIPIPHSDSTQNIDEQKPTVDDGIEDFINDEINNVIDKILTLGDITSVENLQNEELINKDDVKLEEEESTNHDTSLAESGESEKKSEDVAVTDNYTDHVQKIIKRVEDIYSQLDDIHDSDSLGRIPIFKESDISEVRSDIFLTPFMHAVKQTRENINDPERMSTIEKSPSYYNVMNFLDNLASIQIEIPYETYVARLCDSVHVYQQATVYHQTEILQEAEYSSSWNERSSCLRKSSEEKHGKCKKVSFLGLNKEDKSSQVTLCPFHRIKAIKISSQQFPPLVDSSREDLTENVSEIKNEESPAADHKPTKIACAIQSDLGERHDSKREVYTKTTSKNGDGCAKTTHRELSTIDDKSTQVFCQMQKEQNLTDCSITEEETYMTPNEECSLNCAELVEDNPDDSKSTDKDLDDSLVDTFYDYTNNSITTHSVMQKLEGINDQNQPNIAVFTEVLDVSEENHIESYKKRLEKRKELRLRRKPSVEILKNKVPKVQEDNKNVVLLKSFYAFVYILMFTALNMDYRCI